jgi:hypothetical protein
VEWWEIIIWLASLLSGLGWGVMATVAPDREIRRRRSRLPPDFGKEECPSVFERIVCNKNPRHVRIAGIVVLCSTVMLGITFVDALGAA